MFWQPFTASLIACAVTTAGILAISRFPEWSRRRSVYLMSFAAGILISVSFLHLVPKAFRMNALSPGALLAGFFGLYLVNRIIRMNFCDECGEGPSMQGVTPIIGIALHSFVDGLIYAVTFRVDLLTGVLAAAGMVLHEFPEGVISFGILNRAGFSVRKSAFYAFLAAGLSTPLGVAAGYPFISLIDPSDMGLALGVSAGALIYAGAVHLLPAIEKENKRYAFLMLAAGILTAMVIKAIKAG
ncbi:MAG: ZIP family metal transporter [Candidatus Omnitrophica bacterium]|nr:ZIP family metal transporter [Candidatus Omnitrophota bacterium]